MLHIENRLRAVIHSAIKLNKKTLDDDIGYIIRY